jgi:hypothetical protein
MKTFIAFALVTLSTHCFAQKTTWTVEKLGAYFKLNCIQATFPMHGKDTTAILIYPDLYRDGKDVIANAIKTNELRFQYLLVNCTKWESIYNPLYPDSIKIRNLYLNSLQNNKPFIKYITATVKPFETPNYQPSLSYSKEELLKVASRFFYCDSILPDTSIAIRVCVGLNGIKEAKWKKDYTLLEAFCFEAVFVCMQDREKSTFMKTFTSGTKELKKSFLAKNNSTKGLLEFVRLGTFERMLKDKVLEQRLLEYYTTHAANLSFKIR